jgi:hypothetical protein
MFYLSDFGFVREDCPNDTKYSGAEPRHAIHAGGFAVDEVEAQTSEDSSLYVLVT